MKDCKGLDKLWVVLSNLAIELANKNILVPEEVFERLRITKALISYYLLDEHVGLEKLRDVERELNYIQSKLFPLCDEELLRKYLDLMEKALRSELNIEFPLDKSEFNPEVKKVGEVECIRIKVNSYIDIDRLKDLSEWYGVIFNHSSEDNYKITIEGSLDRVKKAVKDFSIIWKLG
ncbi:Uncharacterized conserved protein UCP037052 [Methanocaldococcus infernus ME]|uniref:Uncharacterized conserved protein UCP037052 n=1 Tax=Methanocaldococcus infernus (strain DSM 11812 / JCM 15783 / ME) TaxID=573063 RepID=D5VTD7_METIM|nr:DUF2096 family protein [Methanocaldococcus infernus]ADG13840.1 Uncharacterized conserved protein UCP037052 [Methanocaldococcus infernus ME]